MDVLSKIDVPSINRFHHHKGLKPSKIYQEVTSVYGEMISQPMMITSKNRKWYIISKYYNNFKNNKLLIKLWRY